MKARIFGSIPVYGLLIAMAIGLAVALCEKECRRKGLKKDTGIDMALWAVPFAIVGARLYYAAFRWDYFRHDPLAVLRIWEGGLAIYGGVLGALLGVAVFCRIKKIKVAALLDLVLIGFLIGQSIGRWGNSINREAFGGETMSFFRMGLLNTFDNAVYFYHPTFLYESLWNALGFVLLHFLSKRRRYDGQIALCYAAWYGLGRTFIEGLRTDSLYWGPFRVSQMLAAVSCFAAVVALLVLSFKHHDPAAMQVNRVAAKVNTEAEEA